MSTAPYETILTGIANAIRTKSGTSGLIRVTDFSQRIKRIPKADDVRKVAVFATEQTPAQMTTQRLIRCNGRPNFETPSMVIYDAFRRVEWQVVDFPPDTVLPFRIYNKGVLVGDKLYLGSQTNATTLPIINTKTGAISEITGLPSRQYTAFAVVGTKIYCYHYGTSGGPPSVQTIVRIDTTNDNVQEITLDASRPYYTCKLLGQRLFFGWDSGSAGTVIPYIDTSNDTPGTVTGLPSRTHAYLATAGNKLFVAGSAAATDIAVIAAAGTAPNYTGALTVSTITGLPSRIHNVFFVAGNFLYVGATAATTSILRVQHTLAANTTTEISPLPSRNYDAFVLVGTKVYAGSSTTTTTSIVVITNATGAFTQIENLPSRAYIVFQLVGTKLYATGTNTATTLVVINTANDTFSEITGLTAGHGYIGRPTGLSRASGAFLLHGTDLYLLSGYTFTTSMTVINTVNDTRRTTLVGFGNAPGNSHDIVQEVPPSRANPDGGVYLGRAGNSTFLIEIDFATVSAAPSGGSVWVREITGLPSRSHSDIWFANEKLWVSGSTNSVSYSRITVLAKSVLPKHELPVYIKY